MNPPTPLRRKGISESAFAALMEMHDDCPAELADFLRLLARRVRPMYGQLTITLQNGKITGLGKNETYRPS